jgi:hypothetical protein
MLNDDFAVLTDALVEGRRLFANLRKAIAFYLGAKAALVMVFVAGTIWSTFPLSPIQVGGHNGMQAFVCGTKSSGMHHQRLSTRLYDPQAPVPSSIARQRVLHSPREPFITTPAGVPVY